MNLVISSEFRKMSIDLSSNTSGAHFTYKDYELDYHTY